MVENTLKRRHIILFFKNKGFLKNIYFQKNEHLFVFIVWKITGIFYYFSPLTCIPAKIYHIMDMLSWAGSFFYYTLDPAVKPMWV